VAAQNVPPSFSDSIDPSTTSVGQAALMPATQAPAPQVPAPTPPTAPQAASGGQPRVRVFLDCFDCFAQFLRDEINWVDFVRQAQDADVHILSSSRETGGGGREVVLRFVGRARFDGHDHDLRALTQASDTENVRREVILRTVIVGLLDYVAHDGIPPGVNLTVETEARSAQQDQVRDPWNLWVFSVAGDGAIRLEESTRERNWEIGFNADRVTPDWKISFGGERSERVERFNVGEDDEFEARREGSRFDTFLARSLGPHWSVGADGAVQNSTFGNTELSVRAGPAIEYSVFPYEEYATRQFRITYSAGFERAKYNEVTIFDKLEENLWRHQLAAVLDQRQPWGSVRIRSEFSQYLHDTGLYRVEVGGFLSWRIVRGLSFNLDIEASRIRDQLSLPRRGATNEEVLLRLRQLQSGYEIDFSYGLRYTFGSLFNNVVNPRFGN
jgi:hypothetical protein